MANKYMTLEEAAAYLGMSTDKLMRLREQGEIRGFVDRGSWKFTRESVEELGRLMQTDSSPDIPIITNVPLTADEINEDVPLQADDEEFEIDFDDAFFEEDEVDAPPPVAVVEEDNEYEFEEVATDDAVEVDDEDEVEYAEVAADSAVEMDFDDSFFDDDEIKIVEDATVAADISDADIRLVAEEVGETVIEDVAFEDGALDFSSSDSDVRLAFDDSVFDSDPDLVEIGSDVQLSGDSSLDVEADLVAEELASSSVMDFSEDTGEARDSDSDVQLIEHASDSDVSFVEEADSDSDIRLSDDFVDESDESSELLVGLDTQSDIQLMTAPDENPSDESSRLLTGLDSESDMRLASAPADDNSATPGVDAGTLAAGEVAAAGLAAGLSADSNDSSRMLAGLDSDSDVRLANSTTNKGDSSDSSRLISGLAEDSDVRLSPPAGGSDDSGVLVGLDSDSDVRLDVGDSGVNAGNELPLFDSDSDVRLSVDGSDLLRGLDPTGSGVVLDSTSDEDSDVVLMTPDDSGDMFAGLSDDNDSFDSGATMAMQLPEDSDLKLIDSSVSLDDESGISLEMDDGMLLLDADESGISLEADDSGISLESLDSGAMIAPSSGITLLDDESGLTLDFDDSGISLDAGDSGIALFDDDDSGISLDPDDMGQTQPMSAVGGALANLGVSGANTMQMDIPASGDTNDSEFELAGLDDDDDDFGTDTSVLMFDDDDAGDEYSVASQPRSRRNEDDLVLEDLDAEDSFEDNLGDEEVEDDFEDEEMDDVWDAEDQDEEDDGFDAGESQVGGFVAPTGAAAAKGGAVGWVAAEDSPWGAGWTTAVSIGAILSAVSAFVGAEMIRTMWMWTQPGQPESGLLSMLGGMFGS
jgi:excisionase family DNA binding protein